MNQGYDRSMLEGSLSQMESAAMNFLIGLLMMER